MPNSWDFNKLNQSYQQNLGRSASQDEYNNWANGVYTGDPENWDYINNQIATSGEAQDYAASKRQREYEQPAQGDGGWNPGGSATVPPTAGPASPASISPPTFGTGTEGSKIVLPPPAAGSTPPAAGGGDIFNIGGDARNAFNGVTYAGFDPQNHQGANLLDPMNAKYALQQFMVNNNMPLTGGQNGNARQLAAALNARYGAAYGNPNFFTAIDAETIMMPDGQYIHAAPVGYGLGRGTYDPNTKSEVFWSSTDRPYTGQSNPWSGTPTPGSPTANAAAAPKSSTQSGGSGGFDLSGLLGLLGNKGTTSTAPALPPGYGGPTPPIQPGNNTAGDDPLSKLITSGLAGLILHGGTPYGQNVMATLNDIIGGRTPNAKGFSGPTRTAVPVINPSGAALPPGVGALQPAQGAQRVQLPGANLSGLTANGDIPFDDPNAPPPQIGANSGDVTLGDPNAPPPQIGNGGNPVVLGDPNAHPPQIGGPSGSPIALGDPNAPPPQTGNNSIFTAGDPNGSTPLWQEAGLTPGISDRLIAARDAEAGSMQSLLSDARNALASRGLASVPGAGQGAETGAVGRISEMVAPAYASAVGDVEKDALTQENNNVMQSLQLATGMSQAQAANMLSAIGQGTQRQTALAQIALDTLQTNIQWNEFLASYGLQRDQVAAQIQSGNISSLIPLLTLFMQLASQSAQGYIGVH